MVLVIVGCGQLFGPRATLGPGSIVRGRGLYNEVITRTDSEQILQLIVRARYGEPSGLLSVASVTANLKVAAKAEGQFGIGSTEAFAGNLVPLAAGLAYEESPTISYSPVQGERYARSILSPLGLDVLVLLLGTEGFPAELSYVLVKAVNGLRNPMRGPPSSRAIFQKSIHTLASLQEAGHVSWASTGSRPETFALVLHGYAPERTDAVRALLRLWGVRESLADRDPVVLPLRNAFGKAPKAELNVQTRSVYDLIQIAADGVLVPAGHEDQIREDAEVVSPDTFLKVRSSPERPTSEVLVEVRHRGWWFYVAADDGQSKLAFRLLQTLINMRLMESAPQTLPTLTIPIGR